MNTILVTGANGQIASELKYLAKQFPQFEFMFKSKTDLDISNFTTLLLFFAKNKVDYCINCAGYTAVDQAETEVEKAHAVNISAVGKLARMCANNNIPLVHLSSDYVYHTAMSRPYKETDPTEPKGVYARTKLQGEHLAKQLHPHTMIIRTSWVYSSFGKNFVKTMLDLSKKNKSIKVVFDQIGAPTYARDLATFILDTIAKLEKKEITLDQFSTIYNYSNEGVTSWYDFAMAIFELKNINCKVEPIESKDYPSPATRPPFSVLNKKKIKTAFGIEIPHWRESLKKCLTVINSSTIPVETQSQKN